MRSFPRILLILPLLIGDASNAVSASSNRLDGHPSPYLELHSNDPVNWMDWRPEVFERARAGNRLVLVSVGYFSCHWCHVMQRQSYQHPQTAEFLNRNFVAVKIDRELEPEVDRQLIEFVRKLRGVAGWPLHVFLTPEGYPLTGFTYLPRDEFLRVLQRMAGEWRDNHTALSDSARAYFESARQAQERQPADLQASTSQLADAFVEQSLQIGDELQGGFGDTSKFPEVPRLDALLDALAQTGNPAIAEFIQLTLQAMAEGNLRDHIGGGFFRYTTDPGWHTPHFEKMLYDNAMLAALYLKAERVMPGRGHADIALRTLDFVESRLRHPDGGYMSSLSAVDHHDREGGAYLWSQARLAELLSPVELERLREGWRLDSFDGLVLPRPPLQAASAQAQVDREILLKLRRNAAPMPTDDKRLVSWNAMMLGALTRAADYDRRFAERAHRQFRTMRELFFADARLIRFAGHADIAMAGLEDYAQSASAFQQYGKRFADRSATDLARRLAVDAHRQFLREGRWQSKAESLMPLTGGRWVIEDRVLVSPVTLWLEVALTLPAFDAGLRAEAERLVRRVTPEMFEQSYRFGSLIMLRARRSV